MISAIAGDSTKKPCFTRLFKIFEKKVNKKGTKKPVNSMFTGFFLIDNCKSIKFGRSTFGTSKYINILF